MLTQWFQKGASNPSSPSGGRTQRGLTASDKSLLATFLCDRGSLLPLKTRDIDTLSGYFELVEFATGDVLVREGDRASVDYMLWLFDGTVTVQAKMQIPHDTLTMSVLEPGDCMGTIALVDGGPRSVTCVAASPVRCAKLTRAAVQLLAADHPGIAAKLLAEIAMGIASRQRNLTEQFKRYVMMTKAMRDEFMSDK